MLTTADDIRIRLGLSALTSDQEAQIGLLIEQASGLIANAAGKDDDWIDDLTPVPVALSSICIEAVARAFAVPIGVRSQQETLGSYNHSESYPDQLAQGIALTPAEELRVRRIVFGSTSASTRPDGVLQDLYDLDDAPGS